MKLRPGAGRGIVGLIIGMIIGVALIAVIRFVMGLDYSSGPGVFFAGFGGLFGWLWGVGIFSPYSHEHGGFEHPHEQAEPTPMEKLMHHVREAMPGIRENVRPWIQPLMVALGISALVLALIMLIGFLPSPVQRVTTEQAAASTVTPAGAINLFGLVINKTIFFIILAVVILGIIGGTAILLALVMNVLSQQVQVAKKSPPEPAQTEPKLFQLIDFFLTWVDDILEGTKHSVLR
jgi:hypothetical protein